MREKEEEMGIYEDGSVGSGDDVGDEDEDYAGEATDEEPVDGAVDGEL